MDEAWKRDRFAAIERGENPMVIGRMESGYAVMGDTQFLPGYCVLLAFPKVISLEALHLRARTVFLRDMSLLGEAIQAACSPSRINYSIYGNTDAFLHAHVFPRYDWEEEQRRLHPVWKYPSEMWRMPVAQYCDERDLPLRRKIAVRLAERIAAAASVTE